ncbi:MAG: hypothetical protein HQL90_03870 [Magnetococcales bacterium]|nr:hypothetical protein [Magnetococcales bacterium]
MKTAYPMGVAAAVVVCWLPVLGWSADADKGKALHDPSCMTQCHASKANGDAKGLYTRKGRMDSLEKVKAQVSFCNQQVLNTKWWPEDEADVVAYLNRDFYQFK